MGYLNYRQQYTNLPEGSGRSDLTNNLLAIGGGTSLAGSGYLGNRFYNQEKKLTEAAIRKASELADAQVEHWFPKLFESTSDNRKPFMDTVGKVTGALKENHGILGAMAGIKNEANAAQAADDFFSNIDELKQVFDSGGPIHFSPLNASELSESLNHPVEKTMKQIWSKGRMLPRASRFSLIGGLLGLGGLGLYKGISGNIQNDKAKEAYMNFMNDAIRSKNKS